MIRVLHILWSAHFGGIERLVYALGGVWAANSEIDMGVLFGRGEGEFFRKFLQLGLSCHSLGLSGGYDLSPRKYVDALRTFRQYDILHFHSFNPVLAVCAIVSGRRVVYTEHGNSFGLARTRTLADYIKGACARIFIKHYTAHITFNSKFTKKVAEDRYYLGGVTRSVVHNGICVETESVANTQVESWIREKADANFVVGTASRFAKIKRIDRLIRAFAEFQNNKKTVLLLVGDGPFREELTQLTRELRIHDKTIFAGFRENVTDFENLMDVCVIPSAKETFGLTALECLSLGKPAIAFEDGGGIVEIVSGVEQADIVADIRQLIQRLEYYYDHRKEIDSFAADRKVYSRQYDIAKTASTFTNIYRSVL